MRRLRFAAALVALFSLTGCATIPQNSPVRIGPDVTSGLNSDEVYYSQTGPYEGASQEAVLAGFLNAGNGPQNDYAVAREYLTKSFATKWQPNEEVLIQEGTPEIFKVTEREYRVTVGVSASIDADGRYSDLPAGSTRTSTFKFVLVGGQWRISEAPNKTLVISPNFRVLFRAYSLYFFDPSLSYLVPEVRWFPSRASTGTRLLNALLKGPSDWLKPAVVNVIPAGTRLNINSVTVVNGVAQVDLSSAALRVPDARRPQMKAQISATLEQLVDVTSVEISIERTPQQISNFADGLPPVPGTSPIALTSTGLVRLNLSGAQAISGTEPKVGRLRPTDFAISHQESHLALVNASGVYLFDLQEFNDQGRLIDGRPNQLAPSFDPQGSLWTLTRAERSPFVVTGNERIVLRHNWVPTGVPVSFSVSGEGARVAVVYQVGEAKLTYVFPIERDRKARVIALGEPLRVTSAPANASSVSWADSTTLALLAPSAQGGFIPCLVTVGGRLTVARTIEAAKSVVVNGTGQMFVLQPNGNVVQARGSSWSTIAQSVLAMHLAGN